MVVGDRMVVRQSVVYPSDGTAVRELRDGGLYCIFTSPGKDQNTVLAPSQSQKDHKLNHPKLKLSVI